MEEEDVHQFDEFLSRWCSVDKTLPYEIRDKIEIKENFQLILRCDNSKEVVIENYYKCGSFDDDWLQCYTWSRGWTSEDETKSVYVNIKTGETRIT